MVKETSKINHDMKKTKYENIILLFRSFLILLFVTSSITFVNAQTESQPKYSEVRIYATSPLDFKKMSDAGLAIDHATRKPGLYLDAWLSEYEICFTEKVRCSL